MCCTVYIGEHECTTVAELRAVAPVIVWGKGVNALAWVETSCLCGVDVPATAEANGMTCKDTGMYYEFYPAEGSPGSTPAAGFSKSKRRGK